MNVRDLQTRLERLESQQRHLRENIRHSRREIFELETREHPDDGYPDNLYTSCFPAVFVETSLPTDNLDLDVDYLGDPADPDKHPKWVTVYSHTYLPERHRVRAWTRDGINFYALDAPWPVCSDVHNVSRVYLPQDGSTWQIQTGLYDVNPLGGHDGMPIYDDGNSRWIINAHQHYQVHLNVDLYSYSTGVGTYFVQHHWTFGLYITSSESAPASDTAPNSDYLLRDVSEWYCGATSAIKQTRQSTRRVQISTGLCGGTLPLYLYLTAQGYCTQNATPGWTTHTCIEALQISWQPFGPGRLLDHADS